MRVAGVDEAGRGPLAGPVVACAVILPRDRLIRGLRDSKTITPQAREKLFVEILTHGEVGLGLASEKTIDAINILQATRLAMRHAVEGLREKPEALLVDGRMRLDVPDWNGPYVDIIDGDALSASVAAASIVAKVVRDQIMLAYHALEPRFAFDAHKGYGTEEHLDRLREFGPSVFHRKTFRPIRRDVLPNGTNAG